MQQLEPNLTQEDDMGEDINIERIECVRDLYQIDIRYEESGKMERLFISKHALFALLCVAEKNDIPWSPE